MTPSAPHPTTRPTWRGVIHSWAAPVALVAGAILTWMAPSTRAAWGSAIFTFGIIASFGASATYHRITWGPRGYLLMKRLDHAAIAFLIAGTYTPVCLLTLPPEIGTTMLGWVWAGAGLIVLRAIVWPRSPRAVSALLYVALGWTLAPYFPELRAALTSAEFLLLAIGGVVYMVGAVMYATKRPDPIPGVFGYHEVFHVLTVVGCTAHFAMVALLVQG